MPIVVRAIEKSHKGVSRCKVSSLKGVPGSVLKMAQIHRSQWGDSKFLGQCPIKECCSHLKHFRSGSNMAPHGQLVEVVRKVLEDPKGPLDWPDSLSPSRNLENQVRSHTIRLTTQMLVYLIILSATPSLFSSS